MRVSTLLVVMVSAAAVAAQTVPFRLHGQAWTEAGRIMESSRMQFGTTEDSIDVDGGSIQSTGAQVVVVAELGEKLTGSFGVGARQVSNSLGVYVLTGTPNYTPYAEVFTTFRGYIAQANLTYSEGGKDNPWLAVTLGTFSHVYNSDAHNLGGYLLRGPVYPGLLVSGFQHFALDTAKATKVGARVHHRMGKFSHDLLFLNEHDLPPTFDWSLAYIAKYRAFDALEIGAGVNFHRILPYTRKLTEYDYIASIVDTAGNPVLDAGGSPVVDTTTYSHQGTKLMAMFSLDMKRFIPVAGLGPEDLKLYGEIALLGVKNYGSSYQNSSDSVRPRETWSFFEKRAERIPVMVGLNLPAFGFLDRISVEVERYNSPYRNDLYNLGNPDGLVAPWRWNPQRPEPSPVPVAGEAKEDTWKWSVLLEKTVASHVRFTGQVASDHYRPLPFSTGPIYQPGGTGTAFASPKEWYFMGRLGFFF